MIISLLNDTIILDDSMLILWYLDNGKIKNLA